MPSNNEEMSDCDDFDEFTVRKNVNEKKPFNNRIFDDSESDEEIHCEKSDILKISENEPVSSSEINEEDSESFKENNENFVNEKNEKSEPKVQRSKVCSRKAKLNALEEIHSESQRMVRESRVSLPYHRPKQRSLADFLERRKSMCIVPLKTTKEKLSEVWQQIEEREKMTEQLYNSETDESDNEKESNLVQKEDTNERDTEGKIENVNNNYYTKNAVTVEGEEIKNTSSSSNEKEESDAASILVTTKVSESFAVLETSYDIDILANQTTQINSLSNDTSSISEKRSELFFSSNNTSAESVNNKQEDRNLFPKVLSSTDIFADSQETCSEIFPSSLSQKDEQNDKKSNDFLKNKLNLLSEDTLNSVPKISGSDDDVINLDENLHKTGTIGLMKRFMKHIKLKPEKSNKKEEMSIISSEVNEKGEIVKLTEETISIKSNETKSFKLGKKLDLLKASLQQQMSHSREQQLAKKIQDYRMYEEELEPEDKENDGIEPEEEELDSTDTEAESEPEENDILIESKPKKVKSPFVDDEAEVSEDDEATENDDETTENDDEPSDDDLSEQDSKSPKKDFPNMENLLDDEFKNNSFSKSQNEEAMMNSLLELCSGKFTSQPINLTDLEETQRKCEQLYLSDNSEIITKIAEEKMNEVQSENESDEEIVITKPKNRKNKVYNITDDEESEVEQDLEEMKNDEVYDGTNESDNDDGVSEEGEVSGNDGENEIKNDNQENYEEDEEDELARKLSKGFLDGEAELSGSEWDSADEDEKDLDELEAEVGDEDKISEGKLQKELGRIHFKEMMADDKRDVRLLQELLLEDGELHSDGPKRQRIFKWYNDDSENLGPDRYVEGEDSERYLLGDEDDETWRRTRTEREKYLREKNIDNLDDLRNNIDSPSLNIGKPLRSIPVVTSKNILKSPDPKQQFKLVNARGSFLNRSEKILNKLAQISTNTGLNENPIGSSKRKKNMVFAVVSPPKPEPEQTEESQKMLKRKSDVLSTLPLKKLKFTTEFNVSKKISLLEKLKQSDEF